MAVVERPQLVIPIAGSHVRATLEKARPDLDKFRREEMGWLGDNDPFFKNRVGTLFERMINEQGIEMGEALMFGLLLGSHSVRSCVDDSEGYSRAAENYRRNLTADRVLLNQPGAQPLTDVWRDEERLMQVFGDADLTAALLEVRHDQSRDSAAVTIGYYCLAEVPPLPSS